ncbi:hypothetical protein COCOBI_pt-2370 (chloroplast) [Coccomyxa sp. Obi]|nr:hypothetical protein COCOBI_pt-2370 [Coccomyxa sp. Obi]
MRGKQFFTVFQSLQRFQWGICVALLPSLPLNGLTSKGVGLVGMGDPKANANNKPPAPREARPSREFEGYTGLITVRRFAERGVGPVIPGIHRDSHRVGLR